MSAPSLAKNGPVLVIDDKPLRLTMLTGYLDRLGYVGARPLASAEDLGGAAVRDPEPPALVIISIGASRLDCEGPARTLVAQAERAFPASPLVLISDIDTRAQVLAALSLGVKGSIHTDVSAEVMSLSLQLVRSGGSIAPTRPFLDDDDSGGPQQIAELPAKKKRGADQTAVVASDACDLEDLVRVSAGLGGELDPDDGLPHFSPRQWEVLSLIRSGAQNKHIAHRLNMCEGTVKVHVRNIFRKLSVTNRTQAAFVTAQQLGEPFGRL